MRVFIERFVLGILAPLFVLLAATNPMGFSWPLRTIGIILTVVVAGIAAYFAGWDEWRWERLRGLWWLWSMLGLSGGIVLALWLIPLAVQSQLKEAQQERDHAKHELSRLQSQLASTQTALNDIKGREETRIGANVAIVLADAFIRGKIPPALVILTSSPDNERLRHDLLGILSGTHALSDAISSRDSPLLEMGPPNYERDLDAPRLIARGERGITVHGRNQAADFLIHVLSGACFVIHQTAEMPDGLLAYYRRLYPTLMANYQYITWVEIGHGFPLHSPGCLDH